MRVIAKSDMKLAQLDNVVGLDVFPLGEHKDGSVSLMVSVKKGVSIPLHKHRGAEETYVVSGRIDIGGGKTASAGDYVLMDKDEQHVITAQEDTVFFVAIHQGFDWVK